VAYFESASGLFGQYPIGDLPLSIHSLWPMVSRAADNFSIVPDQVAGVLVTFVPHDLHL
jgi:hypothetical protein